MLNIHFTLAYVVAALRGIAGREPDRIGQTDGGSCIYGVIKEGALVPMCIVGQFVANEGLLRLLIRRPGEYAVATYTDDWNPENYGSCGLGEDVWSTLDNFGVTFDVDAKKFLHCVQVEQDNGSKWGVAFENGTAEFRKFIVDRASKERDAEKAMADDRFVVAQREVDAVLNLTAPEVVVSDALADWEKELLSAPHTDNNGW